MVDHMSISKNALAGDHHTGARDIMGRALGPGTEWVGLTDTAEDLEVYSTSAW